MQKKVKSELITVAIPVYNMAKSIVNAINSVIAQTYENIEILIVNDGSTDNSMQIIRDNIHDPRLRIYERPANGGVCAAMRDLVDQAKGTYICFLDADDTMMPTRVEKQYNAIKNAEKYWAGRMVASFCGSLVNDIKKNTKYQINPFNLFSDLFGGGTGHSMYKVQDLQDLGNFDTHYSRSADSAMCINFLLHNGFYAMVNEPLIVYNYIWDESKKKIAQEDRVGFLELQQQVRAENPTNIYLRRFAGLPVDMSTQKSFTDIDLFGIKGLRLLSIQHKDNGVKHIIRLFGIIPLLRIKIKK